jgi:hypothetical protein
MFDALSDAISELDVPVDGEALAELIGLRDRLDARISAAVAEVDLAGLWELDGSTSMTSWLRHRAGLTSKEAARTARTAASLRRLPVTRTAWEVGELTGGQVQVVLARVGERHNELFAAHDAEVVPRLEALDLRDTARAMARWAEMADALDDSPEPPARERSLRVSRILDGRVVFDGELDADSGEIVLAALRMAETPDVDDESRTPAERRADALTDVCRFFLDHQLSRAGGRHRPHVNVVVEADDLYRLRRARYLGGEPVSPSVAAAILCDSVMHRTVVDPAGAILDYGRATRTISAALWAALVVRDQGCRFPGCDREPRWCEAHHVVWFSEGGDTSIWNLVLLCSRHHHRLHEPGWRAKLLPDARFEVTHPDGWVTGTSAPRSVRLDPPLNQPPAPDPRVVRRLESIGLEPELVPRR